MPLIARRTVYDCAPLHLEAVLNDALGEAFRRHYPGFRPANDDEAIARAA